MKNKENNLDVVLNDEDVEENLTSPLQEEIIDDDDATVEVDSVYQNNVNNDCEGKSSFDNHNCSYSNCDISYVSCKVLAVVACVTFAIGIFIGRVLFCKKSEN